MGFHCFVDLLVEGAHQYLLISQRISLECARFKPQLLRFKKTFFEVLSTKLKWGER